LNIGGSTLDSVKTSGSHSVLYTASNITLRVCFRYSFLNEEMTLWSVCKMWCWAAQHEHKLFILCEMG